MHQVADGYQQEDYRVAGNNLRDYGEVECGEYLREYLTHGGERVGAEEYPAEAYEVEGEDVYAKVPTENKEFYIKQLPDYIEKLKKDNELIKILDDEDTIKVAKSAMIKNETKNEDNEDEDEDEDEE